jgi:hypothetical protein
MRFSMCCLPAKTVTMLKACVASDPAPCDQRKGSACHAKPGREGALPTDITLSQDRERPFVEATLGAYL